MRTVFADTFYFLALENARDQAHPRAVAFATTFSGQMLTTAWVLTEFGDAMCDPRNRLEFVNLLKDLQSNPQVRIVPFDQSLFEEGIQLYASRPDKSWSLTDCISFVVMQREGISEALTGPRFPRAVERGTGTALPWRFGRVRKLPGRVNRMTETISPDSGLQ